MLKIDVFGSKTIDFEHDWSVSVILGLDSGLGWTGLPKLVIVFKTDAFCSKAADFEHD